MVSVAAEVLADTTPCPRSRRSAVTVSGTDVSISVAPTSISILPIRPPVVLTPQRSAAAHQKKCGWTAKRDSAKPPAAYRIALSAAMRR